MADVVEPPNWITWWSVQRSLLVSVVGSGALGAATSALSATGDGLAVAGVVALWSLTAWTVRETRRLLAQPLVMGDVAVRQLVLGRPAMRVRAWAGHGREFEVQQISATWHPPGEGAPQALEVDMPRSRSFVGPLTITVMLSELPVGEVEVDLQVSSGMGLFDANRRYPLEDLRPGPLAVAMRQTSDGLVWQRDRWDCTDAG